MLFIRLEGWQYGYVRKGKSSGSAMRVQLAAASVRNGKKLPAHVEAGADSGKYQGKGRVIVSWQQTQLQHTASLFSSGSKLTATDDRW